MLWLIDIICASKSIFDEWHTEDVVNLFWFFWFVVKLLSDKQVVQNLRDPASSVRNKYACQLLIENWQNLDLLTGSLFSFALFLSTLSRRHGDWRPGCYHDRQMFSQDDDRVRGKRSVIEKLQHPQSKNDLVQSAARQPIYSWGGNLLKKTRK